MEYQKKDLGSYKLHMIKTTEFKTIKIRICFRRPIKKEEITSRNILAEMLTFSSEDYRTRREFMIKTQDLYAANITCDNSRLGSYIHTNFYLNVLNDKYTEEGNYHQALQFLHDIIYRPNVYDRQFNEESLAILKNIKRTSLEGIREDANYYSTIRLYEVMEDDGPISYRMMGYLDDLEKIDGKSLYYEYKKMIDKDLMDIFVIGDIDFVETEELIRTNFPLKTFKKQRIGYLIPDKKPRKRRLFAREKDQNLQSKLAIGCRTFGLNKYERDYPLTLYNIILGAGDNSKLFQEVREKNSLCYFIYSVPNKQDNTLLIRAGVDKNNIKKTIDLVETQLNAMRRGKFSDDDLQTAKEYFSTALDSILESQNSIIDTYFMIDILHLDDIETRRKKMNEVTVSEVVKVAKKIKMDTIYCLEGDKE